MSNIKLRKKISIACACYLAVCLVLVGAFAASTGIMAVKNSVSAPGALAGDGILDAVLAIFTAIGEWFTATLPSFFALFYVAETGLTFLGVLAVCGLGFSIVFLNFLGHYNREVIHESTLIAGNTF